MPTVVDNPETLLDETFAALANQTRRAILARGRRAQYRPCEIDATPLEAIATWTDTYRPMWEARFDRLDTYLAEVQARPLTKTKTKPTQTKKTESKNT